MFTTEESKIHDYDYLTKNPETLELIERYLNLNDATVFQMDTTSPFNISNIKDEAISGLVNFAKINDHRFVNKFFEAVNLKLNQGAIYICCAETKELRKERVLNKYPKIISYPYYLIDFSYKRVIPKVPFFKRLYFSITKGRNRVVSYPETLGRLFSCGFEIIETKRIDYLTWFVVRKVRNPDYNFNPTYGALVALNRVGLHGKMIKVYKMRTMHPYSEYLQEYLYNLHGTVDGDKIINDFRVTTWGRIMRKLWIDELPMLINFFKGELKLVGNRPLSKHKFSTYPKELQEYRIKYKPGLVPPFYSDMPSTPEEFYETERNYLIAYEKSPFSTDVKYFVKAFYNIIFKNARSS